MTKAERKKISLKNLAKARAAIRRKKTTRKNPASLGPMKADQKISRIVNDAVYKISEVLKDMPAPTLEKKRIVDNMLHKYTVLFHEKIHRLYALQRR